MSEPITVDQQRKNILRAVHFETPDYIPVVFHINSSCWDHYPKDVLDELMGEHKFLFPEFGKDTGRAELDYQVLEMVGKSFVDGWGCVWETSQNGIVGSVTRHPLSNWEGFENYHGPDPEKDSGKGSIDWKEIKEKLQKQRAEGTLAVAGLRHGHTFQTLTDIRGYENVIMDMYDAEPKLKKLIEIVEEFNYGIVSRYINCGAEMMCYPEDLGMQNGPMISPDLFVKYIKPSYGRLMKPAREAGCIIHMHSDGKIHELVEYLIENGTNVLNLQDIVNGIDWIRENLKGKICIDLDIDRQKITRFGNPEQIDKLILEEVRELGSKEGGLMMIYGLYPGVPVENIKALMDALEKYAFYYGS